MDVDSQPHLVEIVAALKEITVRIATATALREAVDDLLKVTATILPPCVSGGVVLVTQGEPATYAATGLPAEVLDEAQHAGGDGPSMEAVRTRDIVVSHDLGDETRWPVWSETARRHGVEAVLSYPFDVDPLTLGALNLYSSRSQAFTGELPVLAMMVADHASLLLRVRLRQLLEEERFAQSSGGDGADVVIERAVGIVMAQRGCPPEQALRHLHDAATQLGVNVRAVADRLVRTVGDRAASSTVQ